ncbi:nickel-dependent lactate racemase [Rhizobium laguerreae]
MNTIALSYGRGHLDIALPPDARPTVIRKQQLPKLTDGKAAVIAALHNPVASKPLADLAKNRKSACILICDITRPVPNGLFLRPMIEMMISSGIPQEKISVLVATGLHRPNLGDELAELVGDPRVLANVRVENHYARDEAAHVDFGFTRTRHTPVKLDRLFAEADLRIATGLVEPHFMAGWSGGRKVIAPGVAHHETIRTFHSARFMEDPLAVQCNLIGNPLHEEQLEIVRMLGEVYALNTVLDENRDLVCVTFGEIIASHQAAIDFVSSATQIPLSRKFSTVVTSSAGYPLDKTYYQTIKGMVTPLDILETRWHADHCLGMLGRFRFTGIPRGTGAAGRTRPRAFPGDPDGKEPRRDRRMANGDAVKADAAWQRRTLYDGPCRRRPQADRRRHDRQPATCHCSEHHGKRRPGCRRHPGGAVCRTAIRRISD